MANSAFVLFTVILILTNTLTVVPYPEYPKADDGKEYPGIHQHSRYYTLNFCEVEENGKCVQHISVIGKGIKDTFKIACSSKGVTSVSSERLVVYDNIADSFSLFSNTEGSLDIVDSGFCTRRMYSEEGHTTSQQSIHVCNEIQLKVKHAIDEYKKTLSVIMME